MIKNYYYQKTAIRKDNKICNLKEKLKKNYHNCASRNRNGNKEIN